MSKFFGRLRNPWRYPEFMEYGLAFAGLLQSVIAWTVFAELEGRRALAWTLLGAPHAWALIGVLLCAGHIWGLWLPDRERGYRVRLCASHASCAFWMHFVGTITALSIVDDQTSMATLTSAAVVAPYSAFVVCVRLWKEWQ